MVRPPRLSEKDRERLRQQIVGAAFSEGADKVIDAVWSKLEADMQDRITTLIAAAQTFMEVGKRDGQVDPTSDVAAKRKGLEEALAYLAGREVAATSTKQLREGPWHGRPDRERR